jgi:hypothetical protein
MEMLEETARNCQITLHGKELSDYASLSKILKNSQTLFASSSALIDYKQP